MQGMRSVIEPNLFLNQQAMPRTLVASQENSDSVQPWPLQEAMEKRAHSWSWYLPWTSGIQWQG